MKEGVRGRILMHVTASCRHLSGKALFRIIIIIIVST